MIYRRKILGTIGTMSGINSIPTPFMHSMIDMIKYNEQYICGENEQIKYVHPGVSFHSTARNEIIAQAQGDWVLMLDTDHQFEPDLLQRLLRVASQPEVGVLTGLYVSREFPHEPKFCKFNEWGGLDPIGRWSLEDGVEAISGDAAGAGCLFIKKEVLRTIIRTYKPQLPFDILYPYSEDMSFFLRCYKLKIPVWCNPRIEVPHLSWNPISLKDFKPEALNIAQEQETTTLIKA
jgi:glycosyltransferase involved in cell wall biosynthesis